MGRLQHGIPFVILAADLKLKLIAYSQCDSALNFLSPFFLLELTKFMLQVALPQVYSRCFFSRGNRKILNIITPLTPAYAE